jgi:signal transduction histidine kinase/ActR/RegA family two-component response regulator
MNWTLRGRLKTLRSRLFVLVAVGLVPLALMAAIALRYEIDQREKNTQQSALELSRALGTAVDAELRSTVDILKTLSNREAFDSGDLARVHRAAQRLAQQQSWRLIILTDEAGRTLFRTNAPFGTSDWQTVEPESLAEAFATQKPTVGKMVGGPGQKNVASFGVRYPFMHEGRAYVLSAVLTTESVINVMRRQSLPETWVVSVLDKVNARVARSPATVAPGISQTLTAMLAEGKAEGTGRNVTVEGRSTHIGYSRLKNWGWTVVVGVPFSQVTQASFPPLASLLAGLFASLVLSAFLGRLFGGRISEPIEILKQAAVQLGRGETVHVGKLGIQELDEVGRALEQASSERDAYMKRLAEVQAEREELLHQVTLGLQHAEDAARAKDEFLAVLGHELRNPLAPISMAVELMSRKGDISTLKERTAVTRQVKHMTRLVDDLLDIARITRKQLAMKSEPVYLLGVIEDVLDSVGSLTGRKRIELRGAQAATHVWVLGDEARLTQVFTNLIGNAIKFTPVTGHIVTSISTTESHVEVAIEDDGIGMSQEVLQNVFKPFFQERQGSDRAAGGLGLGLAIVESIVQMHRGNVSATSAGKNLGSQVTVTFPLISRPSAPEVMVTLDRETLSSKIMFVDDNEDAADITAEFLESAGYEVLVAYHPDQALALLEDFVPDLTVLDIGLPGMTGYDLAARWRTHPNGQGSQLIALTGYAQADDIVRAQKAGFDLHLAKPVDPEELLKQIRQLLMTREERDIS